MNRGNKHIPKTRQERDYYTKYIKSKELEPTVGEKLDFKPTDSPDTDEIEIDTTRIRPRPFSERAQEYLQNKWFDGLITIAIFAGGWLVFQSKQDISEIKYKIDSLHESVNEIKQDNKEINSKIQSQELLIRGNQVRVEDIESFIKPSAENTKKEPNK